MAPIEQQIQQLMQRAIAQLQAAGQLPGDMAVPPIEIEPTKQAAHGDLACNVAMQLAKAAKQPPRAVGQAILDALPADPAVAKVEIAGPGFLNFFIQPTWFTAQLAAIEAAGARYGTSDVGHGARCMVEFVSANPTGPLHVGHGRGAIYGDVLANVLRAVGYDVVKEYYVNNAGVQMQMLGRSLRLRVLELQGERVDFPAECYQGDYLIELARDVVAAGQWTAVAGMDEAAQIAWCGTYAGNSILDGIKSDLADCGVAHDSYFFETDLHQQGAVERGIELLRARGHVYEQDGALWFRTTTFGDDKDRVLKKSTGEYTYLTADIAYHAQKLDRGFTRMINILGADHAGYVARMQAALTALGAPPRTLDCVLLQLVSLVRNGAPVSMSTRSGEFETLARLTELVGKDVVRYFFLMRSHNAQLDFDLDLATSASMDNPVYYIQYAHARICSVLAKAAAAGTPYAPTQADHAQLALPEEVALARALGEYPKILQLAARESEPHRVPFYLLDLARKFQSYYSQGNRDAQYRILGQPAAALQAKLALLTATRIVLQNGLGILGITAPERMDNPAGADNAAQ